MKRITTIAVFLSLLIELLGQPLEWGKVYSSNQKLQFTEIIGENQFGTYVLRYKENGTSSDYILDCYTPDSFQLIYANPLILPDEQGRPIDLDKIIALDTSLLAMGTKFERNTGRTVAYGYRLNNNGMLQQKPIKLAEVLAFKRNSTAIFDLEVSTNQQLALVATKAPPTSNRKAELNYFVFNHVLQLLWSEKIVLPFGQNGVSHVRHLITSDSTVFTLSKITDRHVNWTKGNPNFHYVLFAYNHGSRELKELSINLEHRSISDVVMVPITDSTIAIAGFYSNLARTTKEMGGIFMLTVDTRTSEIITKSITDFSLPFMEQVLGKKESQKGAELERFYIGRVLKNQTQGLTLITEQYQQEERCFTDPRSGMVSCSDHFYYNDLLVFNLDSATRLTWARRIPKSQYSVNSDGQYASYVAGIKNGSTYLFFNDNTKNESVYDAQNIKTMTNPRKSSIMQVKINKRGVLTRTVIDSSPYQEITFMPKIQFQQTDSTIIIYGERAKQFHFGRIRL